MKSKHVSRLRAIIADDESVARDRVRHALEREGDVEVVAECEDGERAVAAIRRHDPDVVFLDVQMSGMGGFDVVEAIGANDMPSVVFITGYDEHVLRAFEVHALDYILEPFDDGRLLEVVAQVRHRLRAGQDGETGRRLTALLQHLGRGDVPDDGYTDRIMVRERDRIRFITTADVDWFESEGNYVRLHTGASNHLIRASLSGLLERLDPRHFARIHRSTIVNLDRVREMQPWLGGDYLAVLADGKKLRVSRSYRNELLERRVG